MSDMSKRLLGQLLDFGQTSFSFAMTLFHNDFVVRIALMRDGFDSTIAEPARFPLMLAVLCEAYAATGQPDEGLALLEKSRPALAAMGGHHCESDLLRVRGELLHRGGDLEGADGAA